MTTSAGAMVDAVVGRFLACITEGRGHELGSLYTDDATADMTVPNWRFGVDGPAEISRAYARWFADPGRFDELEVLPVPGGVVVRYLLSWEEDGVPHSAHHCHVIEIDGGRIRRDTVFCGGRWPADLLAKMAAARDR